MATKKVSSKAKAVRLNSLSDDKRWQAQEDLRTLQRAQEIQLSKSRVAAAQREANTQMQALAKVKKC